MFSKGLFNRIFGFLSLSFNTRKMATEGFHYSQSWHITGIPLQWTTGNATESSREACTSLVLCGWSNCLDFSSNGVNRNHQADRGQPSAVIFICSKPESQDVHVHSTLQNESTALYAGTQAGSSRQPPLKNNVYMCGGWGQWRWTRKKGRIWTLVLPQAWLVESAFVASVEVW